MHNGATELEASIVKMEMPTSFELLYSDDIWICDTGASSHSSKSNNGAKNVKANGSQSLGHAGKAVEATNTMDLPGQFIGKDGSSGMKATLTDVNYNPKYNFNLLSLTRLLMNGWSITSGDKTGIKIKNVNESEITFDIVILTVRGAIFACRFIRDADINAASTDVGVRLNIDKAHRLLGHGDEESTRHTAKQLGWIITRGNMKPCMACARAKAKQKNICKASTSPKATEPGGRVFLDLSKVTVSRSDGSDFELKKKWWKIMVDQATGKKWSEFTDTKSGMVEPTCEWMHQMKEKAMAIKIIRLDPAGENIKLEIRSKSADWKLATEYEFTSRDTPQHNNLAELAFPYLAGRARAMMGAAHMPGDSRGKVSLEVLKCATMLDGLRIVEVDGKQMTRDEHIHGKNPKWATNLRTWGEAGVVKEGKDGKTGDKGIAMMFVGYPLNREADSVRMWNQITNGVVTTRDVIWLKRMFFERKEKEELFTLDDDGTKVKVEASDEEVDDVPDLREDETKVKEANESDDESVAGEIDTDTTTTRSGRTVQTPIRLTAAVRGGLSDFQGTAVEMKYLGSMAELDNEEIATTAVVEENVEISLVGAGVGGGFENTSELKVMNYREAMQSPDAEEWKAEVKNEKERFDKFNVITVVPRNEMKKGVKAMTTTWAMKKKPSGKLRGRLNARGYEQVEGKSYYSDSIAAPVTNANSVRIVWVLMATNPEWIAKIVDVEGAFLQGKFVNGEVMYIEVPDGMEEFYGRREDVVLLLNAPIYGTKQAAFCFYKTLVGKIKDSKYERSKADPCLYYRWKNGRLALMVSWVDDIMALGHPEDVKQIEEDLKNAFACKSEGYLKEYVGSKVDFTRDETGLGTIKITQPVLVQKLAESFDVAGGRNPKTPAIAGQVLVRGDGSNMLGPKETTKFRSGTAICLFMTQWSRPEIFNATRGCARQMSAPRSEHMKGLLHLIKYVVTTKNRGLVLKPNRIWNGDKDFKFKISGRSDSDYAANTDDRRSVSGGRTFLESAPVIHRSATQKFVTLSVTEAESAAGVMVAQDMLYTYRMLTSMGLQVEMPMVLEMDNKGAVDLANNWSVGGRTRHVDVRNYFLRELKDEGVLSIKHVSGEDNEADIFTKNTSGPVFEKHIRKFVGDDEYMVSEE